MKEKIIPVAILLVSSLSCYISYTYEVQFTLWLGLAASLIIAALGIVSTRKEQDWILIIVAFSLAMSMPSFFLTKSWGFAYPMVDSAFDQSLTNLIRESGRWIPGVPFEILQGYSCYPVLHIWTAASSEAAGFDTVALVRIFPFIEAPLVTIFFYLALRKILSTEVAVWAALMYNLDGYWHFWEYFVREFISLIFFSICLYAIFHMYTTHENRRGFAALGLIAAAMTVASHHWTSYNLLLTLGVLAIFPAIYQHIHSWVVSPNREKRLPLPQNERLVSTSFLLFTITMIAFWISFIAYSLFIIHGQQFIDILHNLIIPASSQFVTHTAQGLSLSSRILLYTGYLVLGLLGAIELVRQFPKEKKTYTDCIFESWFIFSAIYLAMTTFLLPSSYQEISFRSWAFAFFGLMPLAASSVVRVVHWKPLARNVIRRRLGTSLKLLALLVLVLPLFSAILVSPPEIRVPGYPLIGDSFYGTALWIGHYLSNNTALALNSTTIALNSTTIALDPWARSVIVPYAMAQEYQDLTSNAGSEFFLNTVYINVNITEAQGLWKTIVFDRELWQWKPNASSDSSSLDARYNSIFTSGSLTVYINMSSSLP